MFETLAVFSLSHPWDKDSSVGRLLWKQSFGESDRDEEACGVGYILK